MEAGSSLKHYKILARLGEGGMGEVYRAEDTRLGRDVALKVLPRDFARDEERVKRFEQEARAASAINHPGIATVYDFDHEGETTFLTMELVEGRNLKQLLHQGFLPLSQLLDCLAQVGEALSAAHRKGVIHRDLKPENVMAADSGFYKILDFGLARMGPREEPSVSGPEGLTQAATIDRGLTGEGSILGTFGYMSPEQVQGNELDARSDLFSFGTLLYELTTGHAPFKGNNAIATFHAIVHDEPAPMSSLRPEIPAELERIAAKCLAKDTEDRYQTASDLAVDLRTLRRDVESGSHSRSAVEATPYRGRRPGRRAARLWLVPAAAALLAVAGWALWPRAGAPVAPPLPAPVDLVAGTASRSRIAVTFFANQSGDPEADWLSQGLPEMLTTDLARSQGLEVLSTQRLYDLLAASGRPEADAMDRATATELARWAGAGVVVSGSIFKRGDNYRIDVQASDTATGQVVTATRVEGDDIFTMADQLADDLRSGLQVATVEDRGVQVVTTSSPQAYRQYTVAMDLYDELRFAEAAEAFRRSVAADPEFALAELRLGASLLLSGEAEEGQRRVAQAQAAGARLPERDRLLAEGLHAIAVEGDYEAGEKWFIELEKVAPEDVEGRFWQARALIELEEDRLAALRTLRTAVDLDPNSALAFAALAAQMRDLGLEEDAEMILRDFLERNPDASEESLRDLP